jgi:hypothetical protein
MASPYIKIKEKDESLSTVTTANTVVALIGFAEKGVIDTPVLCTSKKDFQDKFGLTPKSQPYSHIAAYNYFNYGNSLWFTRIADNTAEEAYVRVLSNDGTGTAAITYSTNAATPALNTLFVPSNAAAVFDIVLDINHVEYEDSISIDLFSGYTIEDLIVEINNKIASSTILAGKVTSYSTDNLLYFKTIGTGVDDSILVTEENGVLTFNGKQFGNYVEPSKASITGNVDLSADDINLTNNYNLKFVIDQDEDPILVDIASKTKAKAFGDVAYAPSITAGFNEESYNINITINDNDGVEVISKDVDVTGNLGLSAKSGYSTVNLSTSITADTTTGLVDDSTNAVVEFAFDSSPIVVTDNAGLTTGVTYSFIVSDFNGIVTAQTVSINGNTSDTYEDVITKINTALRSLGINELVASVSTTKVTFTSISETYKGTESTIEIDVGTSNDLLSTLNLVVTEAPISDAGTDGTKYTVIIDIDGVAGAPGDDIPGWKLSKYSDLVYELNELSSDYVASITGGKLVITSITKKASSEIVLDTTTGANNLFSLLTGFIDVTSTIGEDYVPSMSTVIAKINLSIGDYLEAYFDDEDKLVLISKTEGRLSDMVIAAGSTNNAAAFFFTAVPTTVVGAEKATRTEILNSINYSLNAERGTTSVVYAELSENTYLKLNSEVTGAEDSLLWINSDDGEFELAPANNSRTTVFLSTVWSTTTDIAEGNNGTVNSMFKFLFKEKGTAAAWNSDEETGCYLIFKTEEDLSGTMDNKYSNIIEVYYNNVLVETFSDVSYNRADENWFMTVINADSANGGSDYISVEWYCADTDSTLDEDTAFSPSNPTTGTYIIPSSTLYLKGGNNGVPTSTGNIEVLFQRGIQKYSNPEIYNPHILATPGISAISVINSAINMIANQYRQDILYLVDPPFGLDVDDIADWHNGKYKASGAPTSAINNSYLSLFWSWVKLQDEDNEEQIWCPPSALMVGKLTQIDTDFSHWAIPAGLRRGVVNVLEIEYSPDQSERDKIYDINGNLNVNPIVDFTGVGTVLWGQKTLLRLPSALSRLNVRRMTIYAKKLMREALRKYMFEPNSPDSWVNATIDITNIWEPIRQGGGVSQYQIIFDETTTTASLQDQYIMAGLVRITPVNAIEAIEVTFGVTKQGVTLG